MESFWSRLWAPANGQEKRLHFLAVVGAICGAIMAPAYLIVNHLMDWRNETVWDPTMGLDLSIPFVPASILAYYTLYFVFYPLPLFSMPDSARGRAEMLLCGQSLFLVCAVSCVFFLLLPAEVYTRSVAKEALAGQTGLWAMMFEGLWAIDSPWNSWPSLHVTQAGLLTFFAIHWWRGRLPLQVGIALVWVAMCISILTTKQHFVWDLLTAVALLGATWWFYVRPRLAATQL